MVLVALPLLLSFSVASTVYIDTQNLGVQQRAGISVAPDLARARVVSLLLGAGHTIVPELEPTALRLQLGRSSAHRSPADHFVLVRGENPTPWSVDLRVDATGNADADAERRLLAYIGPPRSRGAAAPALAIGISAVAPELESALKRSLPLAALDAGLPITGHRQAFDPRVCIAAEASEVRLSVAGPGQSCGRVVGRIKNPSSLNQRALVASLKAAVIELGREAMLRARGQSGALEDGADAAPDDQGVLSEMLATESSGQGAADRMPVHFAKRPTRSIQWGWDLLIPEQVVVGGGIGLLTRPPRLDPILQLDLRALFPLGISLGFYALGTYSGTLGIPVLEGSTMLGLGYEHAAAYGFTLRAGLYAGVRLYSWAGATGGANLDPTAMVLVGVRYAVYPGLDLDLSLPLVGTPSRAHVLEDGSVWRRRELGFGLTFGLAWTWDTPFAAWFQ